MRASGAAQLIKILHLNNEISLVMKLSRGSFRGVKRSWEGVMVNN